MQQYPAPLQHHTHRHKRYWTPTGTLHQSQGNPATTGQDCTSMAVPEPPVSTDRQHRRHVSENTNTALYLAVLAHKQRVQQLTSMVMWVQTATAGRRHLRAVGNGEPGVEVSMAIPTTAALANQQAADITSAVNTGTLATEWGKLGNPHTVTSPLPPPPWPTLSHASVRASCIHFLLEGR